MSTQTRTRFDGRAVIVTGAASGIGRETALRFAGEGARVVVADIDADGAAATVSAIEAAGGEGRTSITDVADSAAVEAMVADAVAVYGRLDVLHNNAYWAPLNTTITAPPKSSGRGPSTSPSPASTCAASSPSRR